MHRQMATEETKVLIDFLKKETARLTNAINKAHENGNIVKITYQIQMRDSYQKFLNKLSGETRI